MANQPAIPIDAAYVRCQMFIRTPSKVFSEAHWYSVPNPSPTPGAGVNTYDTQVMQFFRPIANKRANCVALNCSIFKLRTSTEGIYKDSAVRNETIIPAIKQTDSPNAGDDTVNILCTSGDLYRKTIYIGAVPDVAMTNEQYHGSGEGQMFDDALQSYLIALIGQQNQTNPITPGWGFLALNKNAAVAPRVSITQIVISPSPNQTCTVTTRTAHRLANNDVVRLSFVASASLSSPFNQLWTVSGVTEFTFVLNGFPNGLTPAGNVFPGSGYAMKQIKTFAPYTNWTIDTDIGERKRGGRTFLVRGRSKRKNTVGY